MLRRLIQVPTGNYSRCIHCGISSSNKATASKSETKNGVTAKWDLYAGVLVVRLPIISKSLNDLEQQFQNLLSQVEFEKSLKSNFELHQERDIAQRELIKKGHVEVDLDDGAVKQTAQDMKDAYSDELKQFQIAPRITPDDRKNNVKSIDRCLEDSLYLLIQEKLGNESHFLLPQGQRLDGETMRQAAERILGEKCSNSLQVQFFGNSPCGFYKFKYPVNMREKSIGGKVFFYRAVLRMGNLNETSKINYEWLPKHSLSEKIKNESYLESLQKFII